MNIRQLAKENPIMHTFDYKWRDSKNFRFLSDVLEDLGYKFKNERDYEEQTEYNDLKVYFNVEIESL
jgi:hypothetical protein